MKFPNCAATVKVRKLTTSKYPEQEKNMERKRILDPNSYTAPNDLGPLTVNLADITTEAALGPLGERVVPFTLIYVEEKNIVINPELSEEKDVLAYYKTDTELEREETRAGCAMRDHLIDEPDGTLSVWLSPYDEQRPEGRITVGYVDTEDGVKKAKSYGIPTLDMPPRQMLYIAWRLGEFSDEVYRLDDPEDLRKVAIKLKVPEGEPWEFLREYIPLPESWEAIISREADLKKEEKLKSAREIAPKVLPMLIAARNIHEQDQALAYARQQMAARGHHIDTGRLVCDKVLDVNYGFQYTLLAANGTFIVEYSEKGKKHKLAKCGKCKTLKMVDICGWCDSCKKNN